MTYSYSNRGHSNKSFIIPELAELFIKNHINFYRAIGHFSYFRLTDTDSIWESEVLSSAIMSRMIADYIAECEDSIRKIEDQLRVMDELKD